MAGNAIDPPHLEDAVLWEVRYQAGQFREEWNQLLTSVTRQGGESIDQETKVVLRMWTLIDTMLNRVIRIDRMLNPVEGRAADSYHARDRVARSLRAYLPSGKFGSAEVAKARNIIEHSDEYMPRFLASLGDRPGTQLTIGPDPRRTPRPDGSEAFRSYDVFDSEVIVFGQPVNLRRLADEVRALLANLPEAKGSSGRVLAPIPEASQGSGNFTEKR